MHAMTNEIEKHMQRFNNKAQSIDADYICQISLTNREFLYC